MIKIIEKYNCCGCSACVQVCPRQCIRMEEDSEGFLYPIVSVDDCINCGKCEKVCPMLNQRHPNVPRSVFAAINQNDDIRSESSSGGVFSELSRMILEIGGVVFGVAFNDKWETEHICITTIKDIYKIRGSKYSQSIINNTYIEVKKYLNNNIPVLFSGTPCQVLGLKNYLNKDYNNLLTIDVVCHSVPSPKVWRFYLNTLLKNQNKQFDDIKTIKFRDKKEGWYQYGFSILFKDDKVLFHKRNRNPYLKGYLKDFFSRPSCHHCPAKKLSSGSDITLADFWGVQNICNKMFDNEGTSLVICNTEHGKCWIEKANLSVAIIDYNEASKYNKAIENVSKPNQRRNEFFKLITKHTISYSVWKLLIKNKIFGFWGK